MRVDIRVQQPKISIWGYLTYQILIGTRVFPGVAKMAIWGLCANPTGISDGKNEIKEHITPYFRVGEHEFNSGSAQFRPNIPLFDPPRSSRGRDKNSVISAPR